MIGQTMRILDTSYSVITPPTGAGGASRGLDNRFYVDITNIRYNFDSVELMKTLRRLKTLPLFQGFRSTIAGTSCHTNAWRIYFCTEDIPTNFIINNHPVDQLRFQGVTYAVYAKLYTPSRDEDTVDTDADMGMETNPAPCRTNHYTRWAASQSL
ncbi:hypothetical protein DYB31_014690 [Aphanomyces astaci]|uniref:Uncharacterized protein n=1 Tax=Aphanomyces astaci TaxID=112090 RepID=A0A397EUU5_APHAT|nr:hypothetical protein DYB31_014690 [Aphanomyces astaci]